MKMWLSGVLALVAAYLVGRWRFKRTATEPVPGAAARADPQPGGLAPSGPAAAEQPPAGATRIPAIVSRKPLPSSPDQRLESMMIEHRDAMLMLREAVLYEYFKRGSGLAGCGTRAAAATTCWVRFQCALHGQLMALKIDRIDCDKGHDLGEQSQEDALADCVRANLLITDPLGIPAEAAEELGDYVGPLEVPLPYSPDS